MNSNFRHLLVGLSLLALGPLGRYCKHQSTMSDLVQADRLTQLETAVSSQGQILYQIQQQLADNQRDIDMLRGQIQRK